jgi:hypothetical protein
MKEDFYRYVCWYLGMNLRVSFTLPYVFGTQGLYKVSIPNDTTGLEAKIRITLTQNTTGFGQITGMEITTSPGASVEMNPDIEGIANYTKVVIDFPKRNGRRLRSISRLER